MTRLTSTAAVAPEALRGRYPDELERTWQPADAHPVSIRAAAPRRPRPRATVHRASSRRRRSTCALQYSRHGASERDLERLLDLDYYDRLRDRGFRTGRRRRRRIVGVSRYARIEGTRRAECAIVVADGWQGRGLGTELMRTLATAARARAIDCLEGTTLAENPADRRLGPSLRILGPHRAELGRPGRRQARPLRSCSISRVTA